MDSHSPLDASFEEGPPVNATPIEPSPVEPPAAQHYRFQFTGDGAEYFRIWIVNLLLTLLTLGIYSAWAKVRSQRWFYAHTQLDGTGFEYHGNPIAILKGRIVAAALVAVLWLVSNNPLWFGVAYLITLVLTPFLVVLAMRFRLRNSSWRGLRFNFVGGFGSGVVKFVLLPLVGVLSVLTAMPWVLKEQQQFLAGNTRFGNCRAAATLPTWSYYVMAFGVIGLGIFAFLLIGFLLLGWSALLGKEGQKSIGFSIAVFASFYLLIGPLYLGYTKSRMNNLLFNHTRLGDVQFEANQGATSLAWIYASNIVLMVLTLGFFYPWAAVRLARYRAAHLQLISAAGLDQFSGEPGAECAAFGEEVADGIDIDYGF